jgi:hypothetical protein
MKKFLLICLLFSAFSIKAQNPNKGILRGFVADSLSGEVLPFANVYIQEFNRGASTDHRGFFVMASLPHNKLATVTISYVGYISKIVKLRLDEFRVTDLKVELTPVSIELRTIEKIGERVAKENATDLSLQKITLRDLESLPKGVELDIFRSIQSLPGVQSAGDVSARYYVRGSSSNQNLVLLDNTVIYNPYHALGIFSSIDPEMINSLEFYKGGFPAEYAHRLSSVLRVVTKDGNRNKYGGKATLSLLTAKGLFEGPIPGGSFILSGRKNYSDVILKKFRNNNSIPADFYDLFFKINLADPSIAEDAKFTISAFSSRDKIMNENIRREDFEWGNSSFSFNYFQVSDSPLFYQVEVSSSNFDGRRIPNQTNAKGVENKISDLTMRMDFNYIYDTKDEFAGGFKIVELHSKLILENFRGQFTENINHGVNISTYLKYKLLRWSWLGADIGSRLNATRLAGGGPAYFFEPRASFTIRLMPQLAFKSSWGIFLQDLVTISDENEVVTIFEPWLITPYYLDPSNSTHYISGFEFTPTENFTFNVEGYYKIVKNLAIVNENKFFQDDRDFIPGTGESYGLETQSRFAAFPFSLTASYSLMWAFKDVNGIRYAPRYDSRHNVNLSAEYDFGAGWTASIAWSYSSGLPFTQIASYYDKLSIDDLSGGGYLLESYVPFILLGERSIGRLPDYHRLDLNLSKRIQVGNFKLYFDLSVLNAYNRKNLFYFKRDTGERVDMLPFLPSASIKVEL